MILISEQRNAETLRSFLGASVFIGRDVVGKLLYSEQAITGLQDYTLNFTPPPLNLLLFIYLYTLLLYINICIYIHKYIDKNTVKRREAQKRSCNPVIV